MVSKRLTARVVRDYGLSAGTVLRRLDGLTLLFAKDKDAAWLERIQAAIVLAAGPDSDRLERMAALAEIDWRDVLVAAGLANEDWRDRVTDALGPA